MDKFCQFLIELSAYSRSVFSFPDDNLVNVNAFSPNLVCALTLWRSALGLLMGKFCQFFTELSAATCPYFHFWK